MDLLSGLFGQAGSPVAVDLGSSGLKVLAIQPGTAPVLEAIGFAATPPELRHDIRGRLRHQFDQLADLSRKLGLKGRKVVCAIPASQTFCKHLQMERIADVPVTVHAQSAIAQQLGCDPAALVYQAIDVGPLPSDSTRHEVICTAVSRELVSLIMSGMRHAKLEIAGVHGEFMATVRGLDHLTKRADDAVLGSVYLDIGESATKIVIAQGTRVVFVRNIEAGTAVIDTALAERRSCTAAEAAVIRHNHSAGLEDEPAPVGRPEPVAAAARPESLGVLALIPQDRRRGAPRSEHELPDSPLPEIAEQVEILADEVQMCVRYAESVVSDLRIDRLMCMGGGATDRALCRRIARTLRLPAQTIDPLARLSRTGKEPVIGVDLSTPHPEWTVAVGLSLCPTSL
ncbi:MAG: pilus assembly protein PilM [Phycisphaerae bacterium]|nr:pilus assembly protein PilM [Phycisphaerae bacterium]